MSTELGHWSRTTADLVMHVSWSRSDDGSFEITGHDLKRSGGGYEYTATVPPLALPALASVLGVVVGGIPGAWSEQIEDIMNPGFVTWLREHKVEHRFWSWHDFDWFE